MGVQVLHRDERHAATCGWEVDGSTSLASAATRRWLTERGALSADGKEFDVALVELCDQPSARAAGELATLARHAPVVVRLWESRSRYDVSPEDEQHLRFALSVASLVLVEDHGQLVRLAGRVAVDPSRIALAPVDYGLKASAGDDVVDLRWIWDPKDLDRAAVVAMDRAPAGFLRELLVSGRSIVLCGVGWPLEGRPGDRVKLLTSDALDGDVEQAAADLLRGPAPERVGLRTPDVPRWWSRLEEITGALDPQHG